MNYFKSGLLIAMSAIMATNATHAADVNWLSFRGEGGRGDASAASPPTEFDVTSGKNVAWKQATTGRGIGGPLVINDLVIVTAMTAKINVIFMSKRLIARPASVAGSAVFAAPDVLTRIRPAPMHRLRRSATASKSTLSSALAIWSA